MEMALFPLFLSTDCMRSRKDATPGRGTRGLLALGTDRLVGCGVGDVYIRTAYFVRIVMIGLAGSNLPGGFPYRVILIHVGARGVSFTGALAGIGMPRECVPVDEQRSHHHLGIQPIDRLLH